jgi:hypothetical protein
LVTLGDLAIPIDIYDTSEVSDFYSEERIFESWDRDFEISGYNWTPIGFATLSRSTTYKYGGSYSLKYFTPQGANQGLNSFSLPINDFTSLEVGKTYKLSFRWGYTPGYSSDIKFWIYDLKGNFSGFGDSNYQVPNLGLVEFTFVATSNDIGVPLEFSASGGNTIGQYFDNISLKEISNPIEVISYIDSYDTGFVSEFIDSEFFSSISIFDDAFVSESIDTQGFNNIAISDLVSVSEIITLILPGGQEIYIDLYINNKLYKGVELGSVTVAVDLILDRLIYKGIEIIPGTDLYNLYLNNKIYKDLEI